MTRRLTALVAEDEAPQRLEICELLNDLWPELAVVSECEDGLGALQAWSAHKPDVVFLDIRMPGLSGLDVARQAPSPAHIVFVTAYDEFAISAFDAGAIDYLLKPVRADRLAETIRRLRARHAPLSLDLTALADAVNGALRPALRWITASAGDTVKLISLDDVVLFQSEDKYTRVVTASESAHIRMPLKTIMDQLDPGLFWRVHRNAIVRVAAIRVAKPDDDGKLQLWLRGVPEPVRVSDAFRRQFRPM